jgi:hypothetical protein
VKARFAAWLQRRLARHDKHDRVWAPGGGYVRRWRDADGVEVTLIAHGDTFDVYIGRMTIHNVTLSARTVVAVAVWVLLWWLLMCWAGVKLRLWTWALSKRYDRLHEQPSDLSGRMGGSPPNS